MSTVQWLLSGPWWAYAFGVPWLSLLVTLSVRSAIQQDRLEKQAVSWPPYKIVLHNQPGRADYMQALRLNGTEYNQRVGRYDLTKGSEPEFIEEARLWLEQQIKNDHISRTVRARPNQLIGEYRVTKAEQSDA